MRLSSAVPGDTSNAGGAGASISIASVDMDWNAGIMDSVAAASHALAATAGWSLGAFTALTRVRMPAWEKVCNG